MAIDNVYPHFPSNLQNFAFRQNGFKFLSALSRQLHCFLKPQSDLNKNRHLVGRLYSLCNRYAALYFLYGKISILSILPYPIKTINDHFNYKEEIL